MQAKIHFSFMLVLGFVVAALHAGEPDGPPRFMIESATVSRSACTLVQLSSAGALDVTEGGVKQSIAPFIEIRQEGRKLPPLLTQNFVSLSNGDRLPLDPDAAANWEGGRLRVWPAKSITGMFTNGLDLFGPNVVLLFWSLPDGVDDPERFVSELQSAARKRDVVHLRNGDRLEGTITALNAKLGCVVTRDGRKVQTSWSKLSGVAFNTDRQARLRTKKPYFRAVLDGGARVNFLDLSFEEKTRRWVGKTQFGAALDLPEAGVLAVDVRQGLAVDLSDLSPARYVHRPYLGASWPLMLDAAATGEPLSLNGSIYEKGLGTHAPCRITYKLDGQYQRFDALVGIPESSRRGRARIAIELDGKRIGLNEGKELTSRTPPVPIRLDVRKAREMTLIVDTASFGDVQAHVNWAKARLLMQN